MNLITISWVGAGVHFARKGTSRLFVLSLGFLLTQALPFTVLGEAPASTPAAVAGVVSGEGISFFSKKTRLWQGRSQIIYFQVPQTAPVDRYYSFQVDEKIVHLLIPPRILKGSTIGYFRVQPVTFGKTRIGIENARLEVEIRADPAARAVAELQPQIVSPAAGAEVWGEFTVGVEQLSLGDPADLTIPTLHLPNGKDVAGHVVPDQKPGPHARWAYVVNADNLAPGNNVLVVLGKNGVGEEVRSNTIQVDVIKPGGNALQVGLCQDGLNGDRTANDGQNPPKMVNDDKYGQGMVLDDQNEGQSWCLPVWIDKKGKYQMLVTARGEFGGDALPYLAVLVDEENNPATTSRLATTEWQRMPVGHPFALEAGGHILSVRIRNGFNEGEKDVRNLFLQKYELARVDEYGPALAANSGGGSMMAMSAMAQTAGPAGDLHVAFTDNFDGQVVTGPVEVGAQCWWPDSDHAAPPRVDLYVNQTRVASQSSPHPLFLIDPAAFVAGANSVQLRASLASRGWAASVPFTVQVPPAFALPKHPFRPTEVFTRYDSGLSAVTNNRDQGDPDVTRLYCNGESTIQLRDDLAGRYKIMIEARGDQYDGPPLMSVKVTSAGKDTVLGEFPVASTTLSAIGVGSIALQPGAKSLTIGFTNDKADTKGDRNLFVQSVQLVPIDDAPSGTPPRIEIAYAPKSVAGQADAVVARVMDNAQIVEADLRIDGQPQHLDQRPRHGFGPIVFPLLTRDLKPGRHHLEVIAADEAGKKGASPVTAFTVSAPTAAAARGRYERAVFLLNRFGYGPEPGEIAAILTLGERRWLTSRLAQDIDSPAERNLREAIRAQFPNQRDGYQVTSGAIQYLLTEPNPVRARFVMWAENHFSTWINKDGTPAKAREHEDFVELGAAPFFDLLLTSATSPAMLVYLDQRYSYAHRLNENYAREIMELHTLGVKGGYTQKDVTTLADLLTGWTLADEAPADGSGGEADRCFGYDTHLNSGAACRIFGVEFPGVETDQRFNRPLMALEMLSAHPSCATFISRKLCEQYAADPAPPKLIADLAQVYLETGGEIAAVLVAMAEHPDFWASPGKVASPIDFAVRTERMARAANPGAANDLISASGMGMFDRATPDGYPEDNGYSVSSNALLQRWRFAKAVQNDFLGAGLVPDAWCPADAGWKPDATQRIVDLAAVRMTGNLLGASSNEAAQKLVADAPAQTSVRLHALATFICQLPENSLK